MKKKLIYILTLFCPILMAQEWEQTGLKSGRIGQMEISSDANESIYATWGTRLDKSTDVGNTWEEVLSEVCNYFTIDPKNPNILYVVGENNIFKTIDNGLNWFNIDSSLHLHSDFRGSITIDSEQTDTIYLEIHNPYWIGYGGVYRSFNGGNSWDSIWVEATKITIDPVDRNKIYANKYYLPSLWKSSDYGNTWNRLDSELIDSTNIVDIYINPLDSDMVLIGTYRYGLHSGKNGFYLSKNGGSTWEQNNAGLSNLSIEIKEIIGIGNRIFSVVNIADQSGDYISCGVYTSTLDTIFWKPVGDPDFFNELYAVSVAYSQLHNKLFVGTEGNGIFSYSFDPVNVEIDQTQNSNSFSLNQNYPNPFNSSTVISYQIPGDGFVSLKVYDIAGIEKVTLINKNQISGKYEIKFDASKLSSGIYFYKLRIGNLIKTKKMILLK